ncbi:MAG TPA: hypothetical protein VKP64_00930 [Mycobacteriales bacterium]|nr:hypothetical protein [Mycobacteriales bacterium]
MTAPLWVALLVGAAVVAAAGPAIPRGRLRRVTASPSLDARGGPRPPVPAVGVLVALGVAVAAGAAAVGPAGALLAGLAGLVLPRWRVAATRRRQATAVRTSLPGACRTFAAELRAGQPAPDALALAARDAGDELARLLEPAVRGARLGGDVAAMLRLAAGEPGATRLRVLAAAW